MLKLNNELVERVKREIRGMGSLGVLQQMIRSGGEEVTGPEGSGGDNGGGLKRGERMEGLQTQWRLKHKVCRVKGF